MADKLKVLYIGCYRDGGGWSTATQNNILALDEVGVEVVPRPIKFNSGTAEIPERLVELEKGNETGCNILIQHTLPPLMRYYRGFKNIGLYCTETDQFKRSSWVGHLNLMDEVWVCSVQMAQAALISGITVPIRVIPYTFDVSVYSQNYKEFPGLKERAAGDFLFYTIADDNRRKNLSAVIRAFHSEFKPWEPVNLVIKTNKEGLHPQECIHAVDEFCSKIKFGMKLYPKNADFKREIVICGSLSNYEIYSLHKSCDVFILPSHGEAWGLPAFDAMAFGKTPVLTNWGGFTMFMNDLCGWLVDYKLDHVYGMNEAYPHLYYGDEKWAIPLVVHLRSCMREAYENRSLREQKSENGIDRAYDFSYTEIGNVMKEALNERVSYTDGS
jgi:glycosyltransferase involved in cell wall biosynthesis